ncbi:MULTISPECIES: SAM-dependent methyltransferase [unclassified Streptomyces]|uniref:SAM-dependent methyltransferase n=1 Tax=unclassified Streptomyces TaxID=2593676 RepID=UPI00226E003F|nr:MULTISPECIES: cyclopropane-fatty-acyl-phospholipid synthase family protein [unclassified Streptomyces]MCY0922296.1 cyclopropane-fatty-acyl-phospholipid synthase [Streptomyces sp. H27-G5]MCY0958858.1 cyclopropane-fatty-acyl-phospholipid synthase [Streptomyces sp. H27-H5]
MRPVADRLAELLGHFLAGPPPVRLRAWDGSESGPEDAPLVVLRSPDALRRLLWQPGELGLAEAYIVGDLDIEGDLADGLGRAWQSVREHGTATPGPTGWARAAALAVGLGVAGIPPHAPDAPRARLSGRLHSSTRDRAAISHHYDLSNEFYALLLDPSMAYSCGYWSRPDDPDYTPADAQYDKLELICRKVGLRAGSRLLDVGCGWGSLAVHAARAHKAQVTAVTLSRAQRDFVTDRVAREGLSDLVEVQLRHWRHIDDGGYDAVSAVEMGEHVGDVEYPEFTSLLHGVLRPGGRLLIQQMSRGLNAPGGGAFIETYIAPDMHMRPVGRTVDLIEDAGFEVRSVEALREHYARTIDAWRHTLEERWVDFEALVGQTTARVWRLYLAGSSLAFTERRMGVDQILAVRPSREGRSDMPATPVSWYESQARA